MSEPNYVTSGLKALLAIVKDSNPEFQPSAAVLETYMKLLDHVDKPNSTEIEDLTRQVEALRNGQASLPNLLSDKNKRRREFLQAGGSFRG